MKQFAYACQINTKYDRPLFVAANSEEGTSLLVTAQLTRDPTYFRTILESVPGAKLHRIEAEFTEIEDYDAECWLVMMGHTQDVLPFSIYPTDKVRLSKSMVDSEAWKLVGDDVGKVVGGPMEGIDSNCEERLISVEWHAGNRLHGRFSFDELTIVERGEYFTKKIEADKTRRAMKSLQIIPKPARRSPPSKP